MAGDVQSSGDRALLGRPVTSDAEASGVGPEEPASRPPSAVSGVAAEEPDSSSAAPTTAPAAARPRASGAAELVAGHGRVKLALAADALVLALAVAAALLGAPHAHVATQGRALVWLFPALVMALLAIRGMYRTKITVRVLDEAGHVVGACSVAAMVVLALAVVTTGESTTAGLAARVWVYGIAYLGGERLVLSLSERRARSQRVVGAPTLIVGAGRIGAQVERRLEGQPELGLRPVGFIDAYPPDDPSVVRRNAVLGGPNDLEEVVERTGAEHVVLAFLSSRGSDARLVPIVRKCTELGVDVSLVPRLFESINVRVRLEHIGGMPLFRLRAVRPRGWQFAVKHILDRAGAALLVLLAAPLLLAITLAVKLSSPGPVFFRQPRIGRDGHRFDLLKFRSMREDPAPANRGVSVLVPGDTAPGGVEGADRRTAIGRLLRRSSLDELPQLFNVLRGDMSIVGPRPERPEFVELFERRVDRYDDRHRVRSGITGWAQVHGLRGKTSLTDRIELDNFYIENWSLTLDFKIMLMTITAVLKPAE